MTLSQQIRPRVDTSWIVVAGCLEMRDLLAEDQYNDRNGLKISLSVRYSTITLSAII